MDDKADKYFGPFKYLKQELLETSLVSVPANPNAIAVAKSLNVSDDTMRLVFAKHGNRNTTRNTTKGKQAETSPTRKTTTMSTLAQNIIESEKRLLAKKDELAAFHDAKGDGNYTDADMETIGKANADIEHEQKLMTALRDSEKNLGAQSVRRRPRDHPGPCRQGQRLERALRATAAAVQRRGEKAFAA